MLNIEVLKVWSCHMATPRRWQLHHILEGTLHRPNTICPPVYGHCHHGFLLKKQTTQNLYVLVSKSTNQLTCAPSNWPIGTKLFKFNFQFTSGTIYRSSWCPQLPHSHWCEYNRGYLGVDSQNPQQQTRELPSHLPAWAITPHNLENKCDRIHTTGLISHSKLHLCDNRARGVHQLHLLHHSKEHLRRWTHIREC